MDRAGEGGLVVGAGQGEKAVEHAHGQNQCDQIDAVIPGGPVYVPQDQLAQHKITSWRAW